MKKILIILSLVMFNITFLRAEEPAKTITDESGVTYHYYATVRYVEHYQGYEGSKWIETPNTYRIFVYYTQLGNRTFIKAMFNYAACGVTNQNKIYTVHENPRYGYNYFDGNFMYMITGVGFTGFPDSKRTQYFNL